MKKQDKKCAVAKLPKGAYRLPIGGYVTRHRDPDRRRNITLTVVHRDTPDYEKLARAFLRLAEELAEKERESR